MKRFRFELQSVYRIKEHHRDLMREELAKANEALTILEEKKTELNSEIDSARGRRKSESAASEINVDRLISTQRYEHVLIRDVADLDEKIRMVQEELELRRQRLVEADREVKALDILRDHRHRAYEKQVLREEAAELDEVAARIIQQRKESTRK